MSDRRKPGKWFALYGIDDDTEPFYWAMEFALEDDELAPGLAGFKTREAAREAALKALADWSERMADTDSPIPREHWRFQVFQLPKRRDEVRPASDEGGDFFVVDLGLREFAGWAGTVECDSGDQVIMCETVDEALDMWRDRGYTDDASCAVYAWRPERVPA